MLTQTRLVKISKYLSYHLRHHPDQLGLKLAPGGWVKVDDLLAAAQKQKFLITLQELQEVVERNDKQRFSFDGTKTLIRANQGHSIPIDLQLEAAIPPAILYHGTYLEAVKSISKKGIQKMSRHHVHLSSEVMVAISVGRRRGQPIVFQVDAAAMYRAGYQFYCTDNGVWLVDYVPAKYLKQIDLRDNKI
jgi:putative RNA 2'-phosphotransferase